MGQMVLRDNSGIDTKDRDVRTAFPAIFNLRRSVQVSEDYQFYKSEEVIKLMQAAGLRLVEVGQERLGWSQRRQPHTQIHIMRFMSPDIAVRDFGVGDSRPEIVVMNSHDGRCTFRAMAGVFRLVCSNGMIVADQNLGGVIRRHYGEANAFDKVREILADMPRAVEAVSRRIADWSSLSLTAKQQVSLARLLMTAKLPSGGARAPEWLKPEQVLEARRDMERPAADGRRDLWTTFNVLQESLTNTVVRREEGEGRGRAIQPIQSAVGNTGFNVTLWATAEAYYAETVASLTKRERSSFETIRAERAEKAGATRRKLKIAA